jgi:hypothetical protein
MGEARRRDMADAGQSRPIGQLERGFRLHPGQCLIALDDDEAHQQLMAVYEVNDIERIVADTDAALAGFNYSFEDAVSKLIAVFREAIAEGGRDITIAAVRIGLWCAFNQKAGADLWRLFHDKVRADGRVIIVIDCTPGRFGAGIPEGMEIATDGPVDWSALDHGVGGHG